MDDNLLYPPIEPYESGMLDVGARHRIYWEQCGNPTGQPVVFLHGGPGSGASETHRRFFDPSHYRIVLFDQRGAGRSVPLADITDNTTGHLIGDIEKLRTHLAIDRWLVFGGSWGSTLALAYGEAHAERCHGFILRGISLNRPADIEWWLRGTRLFFPGNWRRFNDFIPAGERDDLLSAYYRRLVDPDAAVHLPAARAWKSYERNCTTLMPLPEGERDLPETAATLAMARIMAHYKINGIFLPENALIDNVGALRHIPAVIVQGRYDMICPIAMADVLAEAWPEADFQIIEDAGHSATEPGIAGALLGATQGFRTVA